MHVMKFGVVSVSEATRLREMAQIVRRVASTPLRRWASASPRIWSRPRCDRLAYRRALSTPPS